MQYLHCVIPTTRDEFLILSWSELYTKYAAHVPIHNQV